MTLRAPPMTTRTLYAIDTSPSEGPDDGVNSEVYGNEFLRHETPTSYHQSSFLTLTQPTGV